MAGEGGMDQVTLPDGSFAVLADMRIPCPCGRIEWHVVEYDPSSAKRFNVQCLQCKPPRRSRRTRDERVLSADRVIGRVNLETGAIECEGSSDDC